MDHEQAKLLLVGCALGDARAVSPDLATRGHDPDCEEADVCATELLATREGCVFASWSPDDDSVVMTSVSKPELFSPPVIVVQWQNIHHQGLELLVLRDDAFVSLQRFDLPRVGDAGATSCDWEYTLPNDPGGRPNHILGLERCEVWAPSEPGEPTFAPDEWERRWVYTWNGVELTEQPGK